MKLLLFYTLTLLLVGPIAFAQQASAGLEGAVGQSNLRDFTRGLPAMLPNGTEEGVVGSPYADNRWLPARLEVPNARPLPPVVLKYDVLGRRLWQGALRQGRATVSTSWPAGVYLVEVIAGSHLATQRLVVE